jgi:ATPase subunit of ABC transporter with duplicated ATPase domains
LKDTPEETINYNKYENFNELLKIFAKIGLPAEILDSNRKIGSLSGGEKVKIQMAKLLLKHPDVLLLDEPTNDLDIETLEWLEKLINSEKIPILYVSHDETLLENTANTILHMEYLKNKNTARHTVSKVGYSKYIEDRENMLEKQSKNYAREKREYKEDKKIISNQKSAVRSQQIKIKDSSARRLLNKKMSNILVEEAKAESKLKTDRPETEDPIFISFDSNLKIPERKRVVDLKIDELKIGGKVLARNLELNIYGPEKVGIVGTNGVGKTTLLKYLYNELKKRGDINVGYMPQNYNEILDPDMIATDYIIKDLESVDQDLISAYIGRIKLTWTEMNSEISQLSYGQRAKLMILKMMLDKNDVLILDEPTRNLSAISNPVIRDIMSSFGGCIISVSHDRKFLREICTKVYRLDKDGLKPITI